MSKFSLKYKVPFRIYCGVKEIKEGLLKCQYHQENDTKIVSLSIENLDNMTEYLKTVLNT